MGHVDSSVAGGICCSHSPHCLWHSVQHFCPARTHAILPTFIFVIKFPRRVKITLIDPRFILDSNRLQHH